MSGQTPVLAIDGPSGSGKGTICRRVAAQLGWHLLDSGALYRLVGLAAQRHGIDLDDEAGLETLARQLDVEFQGGGDATRVILERDDVSDAIRTEQAGNAASKVAALAAVRTALLDRQRAFRQRPRPGGRRQGHGERGFSRCRAQGVPDRQRRGTREKTI